MKTNKNTMLLPELFVDDHHGQYMGKIAFEQLADRYKNQAKKFLSQDNLTAIQDIEDEWHHDAVDYFTRIEFHTPSGQKFNIDFADGGMWIIPFCFYRSKAASEFFSN